MTLSRSSSRVSTCSGWPSQSVQARDFLGAPPPLARRRVGQAITECLGPGGLLPGVPGLPQLELGPGRHCLALAVGEIVPRPLPGADAMRATPHPGLVGLSLKPYPGRDGHTTWKASAASPPWPAGSERGPST